MDNDEYRRGNLTTWKKYGYDMAVLAGDKLFIYAFETAAKAFALTDRADLVGKAISILANKAGIYGMIGPSSRASVFSSSMFTTPTSQRWNS